MTKRAANKADAPEEPQEVETPAEDDGLDAVIRNQWLQAKQAGLLDQKGVEHDGLNQERPKGF